MSSVDTGLEEDFMNNEEFVIEDREVKDFISQLDGFFDGAVEFEFLEENSWEHDEENFPIPEMAEEEQDIAELQF